MNYLGSSNIEAFGVTARVFHPREMCVAHEARWEELRGERDCYASPFYSPGFTRAVGEVREDARVALLECAGKTVGFLPFHVVRGRIAKPIGAHLNDYHGAILGRSAEIGYSRLLDAADIDAYDFNHLPQELGARLSLSRDGGSSPQMDLGDGYGAYLEERGKSFRRGHSAVKRKLRKMAREMGELSFEFASNNPAHFRAHAWMRSALYRKAGNPARFGEGWEGEVFERLREIRSPSFRTVLNVLKAGEKVVAAHFGLVSNGVMHWWFPAYAESAACYSPGLALIDFCAREAQQEGVAIIDFGRGDERYKRFFASREVPLLAGSSVRQGSPSAALRKLVRGTVGPLQAVLPQGAQSFPQRVADKLATGVAIPRYG